MNLNQVVLGYDALMSLMTQKEQIKIGLFFKLNKLKESLEKDYTDFQKKRMELFDKYGEKDADGNVAVLEEHKIKFITEINDLLNTDIGNVIYKINTASIGEFDVDIKTANGLLPFLEE